ncbi:MAG: 8-oxoguanine deaminase, partial [Mobilitalea sp.]
PGLVNTHHHLYQIFTRNLPQVQSMELFPWLRTLYELWKNIDEDVIRATSLVGMGELMKNGCTTCFDHHYVFPEGRNEIIETQFAAADELGIRMHVSRGSMSLSKKDGGLPPDSVVQTTDAILKDSRRLVEKYHNADRYSMHQVALAPCSPFSVTPDLMSESAKLARSLGVRLHTHLAETKDEEKFTLETYGMRPLEYMQSLGWIGSDVWFAHGIHFNDEELQILAKTQTGIAHCPISNMKLSSGVARIPEMLHLGIPVGLAVDGSASNDGSNLLEEMRVGYLLHRLQYGHKAPTGYDMLKIATIGGAKVLGRDDIGSLEIGKAADFFLVNTKRFDLVGAMVDPKSVLATVGLKGAVDYTVINGKIVVKQGHLVTIEEEKTQYEADQCFMDFIKK